LKINVVVQQRQGMPCLPNNAGQNFNNKRDFVVLNLRQRGDIRE